MAKYKLPGTYCAEACNRIIKIVLDWAEYERCINIETTKEASGICCDNYIITITAPTIGQDELVENVARLVLFEFDDLVYERGLFLSRCFDDFKKSVAYEQFKTYIINNEGLKAVKLVKDYTCCSLKDAREFWKEQKEGYDKLGYFSA